MGHRLLGVRPRRALLLLSCAGTAGWAIPASAQTVEELRAEVGQLREAVAGQRAEIERQAQQIRLLIDRIDIPETLAGTRGRGLDAFAQAQPTDPDLPDAPVGEQPDVADPRRRVEVRAIPNDQGVLTPAGTLVIDPQIEYVNSSTTRLVFRGIELVPGIQIGVIEASDADRDTLAASATLRYGISSRLEAELRIPYIYRRDRIEVAQQREESIVRTIALREDGIGDVEFGLRYQLNRVRPLRPVFIGSLRVKSNTGLSPFDVEFDEFGVATGLATGSGFWGIQPGLSFLLPSDPVVIFGGVNYLYHVPENIDREIGGVFVGRVDPGDSIGANIGFGFALNPQFSFSLGYRHNYIFPTETEIGDTFQRSNRLNVGQLNFGMSLRVTGRQWLNFGVNIGVTEDAPDVSISLRAPLDFRLGR